jgi:hypothetical protein
MKIRTEFRRDRLMQEKDTKGYKVAAKQGARSRKAVAKASDNRVQGKTIAGKNAY